jgi:hypothetical protein
MQGSSEQQVKKSDIYPRPKRAARNPFQSIFVLQLWMSRLLIMHGNNFCDRDTIWHALHLLVESLGVGGGGSDVSIAGSLVGASGLLQGLGSLHVCLLSMVVPVTT